MDNSVSMVGLWKELGYMNESALVPTILNFLEFVLENYKCV